MNRLPRTRPLATIAALGGCAALFGAAVAPAATTIAGTAQITGSGAGKVKLGATYTKLREKRLVGKIGAGCELGGPSTRSARLRSPLKGSVDFTLTSPRKVTNITVLGGATARGVGIGSTIDEIKAAFPKAKVDHDTEEVFAITLVKIPKSGGGKLEFAVDTTTEKTTTIGIPHIAFCE